MNIKDYIGPGTYLYKNDKFLIKNYLGEWDEQLIAEGSISHKEEIKILSNDSAMLDITYFDITGRRSTFTAQSKIYLNENGIYIVPSEIQRIRDKDLTIPFRSIAIDDYIYETHLSSTEIGVKIFLIHGSSRKMISDTKYEMGKWIISSKYEDNERIHLYSLK